MKRLVERARVLRAVRAFFEARGFLEVETPTLVPSPGLDLHLDAFAAGGSYLSTSPEYQMKRLLADGYAQIFQVCKAFRMGERGGRHNPEFTMLEWYRAHASMHDVVHDTEQLIASVTGGRVHLGSRTVDVTPPFEQVTVAEAFARYAGVDEAAMLSMAAHDEDRYFRLLVDEVEPKLSEEPRGIVLSRYPATQASLARRCPDDARYAERFEIYVAGVELCNGFGELVDPVEQRARFEQDQAARRARGLPVYPIDEKFLAALARGLPPCAGNALGVDRLVALSCGTTEIGDVISFTAEEV